jgi:hypothetical protein
LASSFGGGREADVSTFLNLAIPDPNSPKTPPIPPPPAFVKIQNNISSKQMNNTRKIQKRQNKPELCASFAVEVVVLVLTGGGLGGLGTSPGGGGGGGGGGALVVGGGGGGGGAEVLVVVV